MDGIKKAMAEGGLDKINSATDKLTTRQPQTGGGDVQDPKSQTVQALRNPGRARTEPVQAKSPRTT